MVRSDETSQEGWALAGTCLVCVYLIVFRTYDLPYNYPLLSEQIRDWSVAQRTFSELPWIGPRSPNSGLDIGPVYYWCLWALRVLSAPMFGVLPHVGGIAQAVFVTIVDGVLLIALARRLRSWWLAAAVVVFTATAALDVSLAGVTWNPPIAAAFVKLATAALLWPGPFGRGRAALTVVFAVCAAQCHPSAIFAAIPIAAWTLWAIVRAQGVRVAGAVVAAGVVAVIPWVWPYLSAPPLPATDGHVSVLSSVLSVASDPFSRLRVMESTRALAAAMGFAFGTPLATGWVPWLIFAGAAAIVVRAALLGPAAGEAVRDGALVAVSLAPLLVTIAIFALWQGEFQAYWYLAVMPAAAICCAGLVIAASGRVRQWGIALAVLATLALQPSRDAHTRIAARLPAYGPLVTGVRAAAAEGAVVRGVEPAFDVPPGMDPLYLYALAGGALDHTAPVVLVIEPDGRIRYRPVQP